MLDNLLDEQFFNDGVFAMGELAQQYREAVLRQNILRQYAQGFFYCHDDPTAN
jgi:hypothetical protein